MPLTRYFAWVGSVLLALLFIAAAGFPKLPVAEKADTLPPAIRIFSDHKWPERIVYDTSAPIVRQAVAVNPHTGVPAPPMIAMASTKLREAMAELRKPDPKQLLASNPKRPEARVQQQYRIATKHAAKPMRFTARRSPFGWFASTMW